MRLLLALVTALLTLLWLGVGQGAHAQHFPPVAGVHRLTPSSVYFGGERVWRAKQPGERVITSVLSSRNRDAVAFATSRRGGTITLVVVLVSKLARGHVMTWPIPRRAQRRGRANVMWMGRQRVGFGYSAVRPVVVASWRLRR